MELEAYSLLEHDDCTTIWIISSEIAANQTQRGLDAGELVVHAEQHGGWPLSLFLAARERRERRRG
jgi:hypothetical protein